MLMSDIGSRDGKVYENMLRTARKENPLNKNSVFPAVIKYLRPKL